MKNLAAKITNYTKSHPEWEVISKLVTNNTTGPVYLVGGKVYRAAIELIHSYDSGVANVDWDFLCLGSVNKSSQSYGSQMGWYTEDSEYENVKGNSLCLTNGGSKLDIIGIKDIDKKNKGGLNAYFSIVPLTIQSVALDVSSLSLIGRNSHSSPKLYFTREAEQSIKSKTIVINNIEGALPNLDIERYVRTKATSLKFTHSNVKTPCNCFANDNILYSMLNYGCKYPLTHR